MSERYDCASGLQAGNRQLGLGWCWEEQKKQHVNQIEGFGCDPIDQEFSVVADTTPAWAKIASQRQKPFILFFCKAQI